MHYCQADHDLMMPQGFKPNGAEVNEFNTEKPSISFYPNPSTGVFTMELDDKLVSSQFQVYDSKGILIVEGHIKSKNTKINLSANGKGVYFLKIQNHGIIKKLVVID